MPMPTPRFQRKYSRLRLHQLQPLRQIPHKDNMWSLERLWFWNLTKFFSAPLWRQKVTLSLLRQIFRLGRRISGIPWSRELTERRCIIVAWLHSTGWHVYRRLGYILCASVSTLSDRL